MIMNKSTVESGTVFIVEDDPAALDSVATLVETLGFATERFASAEEFLGRFRADRRGCVVTDLRLPGKSGIELQAELEQAGSTLPVILVSAYADVPAAVEAMRRGAITLLQKPYREHDLWDAIRNAMLCDTNRAEQAAEQRAFSQRLESLSEGEREVLERLLAGMLNKSIASELHVSLRTVEARRHQIMHKMGADSFAQLVRLMVEHRRPAE